MPPTGGTFKAIAIIPSSEGSAPSGTIKFTQEGLHGKVVIKGSLKDLLPSGKHGFHIHQLGDLSNGCASTGSHFNPNNHTHGAPKDKERHAGDLGNVVADEVRALFLALSTSDQCSADMIT